MSQNLRAWLKPPRYTDPDLTLRARNVYILCAICLPCLVLTGVRNFLNSSPQIFWDLAAEIIVVLVVYALNQTGRVRAASILLTASLVGLTTLILFTSADGSHDIAILVYPVTLLLAGLLLDWGALILVTLVTIGCFAAVVNAEITGRLVNRFSIATKWGDLIDSGIILAGTSAILGLWATQFRASIARARRSQETIEQSNRELAAQAGRLAKVAHELQESEARQRAILASSVDGLIVIDTAGLVVEFNPAAERIFGHARAQVLGRSMAELLIPAAMREDHRRGMERFIKSGVGRIMGRQVEMAALHANGSEFRVELTVAPVPGTEPLLFAGVVRDITERIRLEQQLRQAQKMQAVGQLAGGVAHDFNNQLTSVMGFAEILATRLENPEDHRYAEHILQASRRAADLTQKLLAFSRKGKFIAVPVDLHQILVEVTALLRHSLDKRIEIRQRFDAPRGFTSGDPNQLQNAFLNLAINARDAMPNGGVLTFATAEIEMGSQAGPLGISPGRYLSVQVIDTGMGMDEETRKHLFEPFFTTKGEGKGTGLGLAAVYGAVKNHQGAVTVETELGQGTTFAVLLPLLDETAEKQTAAEASFTPTRARELRVLVVDDEDSVRWLMVELLRRSGYMALDFATGKEAVNYYRRFAQDVDLVILDMVMPGMGGRETFAALQAINPKVKALLASGYSLDGEAQTILNDGVLGFVQKPFSQQDLLEAVDRAVKRRTSTA